MLDYTTIEFLIWATVIPPLSMVAGYCLEIFLVVVYDLIFGINLWWMSPLSIMWYLGWISRDLLCFFRLDIFKEEMRKVDY